MISIRNAPCSQILGIAALLLAVQPAASQATAVKARIEECMLGAAQHHRVNSDILRAILRVESNLDPRAIGRNANGSVDLGIGQINSQHFPTLARHGIRPEHLLDGCVGAYVAAWHLSTLISAHGYTWTTIARYHSATPSLNRRYQVLLGNELVAAGVLTGAWRPVRPAPTVATRRPTDSNGPQPPAMVFDDPAPHRLAPRP